MAIDQSAAEILIEDACSVVVLGDAGQVAQVFQNLLANAIRFCHSVPRLHVGVAVRGSMAEFSVRDNGIGIDAQFYERIFVIFQRLHGKDAYPGTGIGLALSKRIVERHDGTIWIESSSADGGTDFRLTIPVADKKVSQ